MAGASFDWPRSGVSGAKQYTALKSTIVTVIGDQEILHALTYQVPENARTLHMSVHSESTGPFSTSA